MPSLARGEWGEENGWEFSLQTRVPRRKLNISGMASINWNLTINTDWASAVTELVPTVRRHSRGTLYCCLFAVLCFPFPESGVPDSIGACDQYSWYSSFLHSSSGISSKNVGMWIWRMSELTETSSRSRHRHRMFLNARRKSRLKSP